MEALVWIWLRPSRFIFLVLSSEAASSVLGESNDVFLDLERILGWKTVMIRRGPLSILYELDILLMKCMEGCVTFSFVHVMETVPGHCLRGGCSNGYSFSYAPMPKSGIFQWLFRLVSNIKYFLRLAALHWCVCKEMNTCLEYPNSRV